MQIIFKILIIISYKRERIVKFNSDIIIKFKILNKNFFNKSYPFLKIILKIKIKQIYWMFIYEKNIKKLFKIKLTMKKNFIGNVKLI